MIKTGDRVRIGGPYGLGTVTHVSDSGVWCTVEADNGRVYHVMAFVLTKID